MINSLRSYLNRPVSIAPLVIFRIAFGLLMLFSLLRFMAKGWVHSMYVAPKMFFPYYGMEWVKPLGETGMYMVFVLMILASAGIMAGALYRVSAPLFFVLFTYVELIDKTNYLNHYYFVSIVAFLLIFLPAHRAFSVDNRLFKRPELTKVPALFLLIPRLQMFLVYFFAGVAKINADWLLHAQPLRTWLPAFSHYPVIGNFMEETWVAYLFSWFGCVYDLAIGFLLFNRRTVYLAYFFVIVFHSATALFFNIGMFPYIMMTISIIFFRESFHERVLSRLQKATGYRGHSTNIEFAPALPFRLKTLSALFTIHFIIQCLLPFRYLLYSGDLFWTEQGYRFSWRVMLMEKAGAAFFTVHDRRTGASTEIVNSEYLTPMQEKMMATQPDMIVDYAKFLKSDYEKKGFTDPLVTAQCYVTVNGRGSREFIKTGVDLASQSNSFLENRQWVNSY